MFIKDTEKKKSVGIITTFRQPNWGSVLQAYALQNVIDGMGFEAWLIDYRYPNDYHYNRGIKKPRSWMRNLPGKLLETILVTFRKKSKHKMVFLNRFIKQNIRVTSRYESYHELHENPPQFDAYIAGSDQIWNPCTMMGDMNYFLDFAPNKALKLSYASSFSGVKIPDVFKQEYINNLNRFSAISVREDNGAKAIKEIIGRDVKVVLDPTLLLDSEHWMGIAEKARKVSLPDQFILCYMLGYTYRPDNVMAKVLQQLQKQYQMPVIALNALPNDFKGETFSLPTTYGVGIEEFLYLMSRASIVASSSFHGTAFALNFGKPLVAIADHRVDSDDRLSSLMGRLKLNEQLILSIDDVKHLNPYYELSREQEMLKSLREKSMRFLQKSLS